MRMDHHLGRGRRIEGKGTAGPAVMILRRGIASETRPMDGGVMDGFQASRAVAAIRERLGHPVIDSDGHLVELRPVAMEYIARAGGAGMAERFAEEQRSTFLSRDWYGLSEAERMAGWTHRP